MIDRFVAMEKFSKVVNAGEDTAEYVEFACPYAPTGMIASVLTVTTGASNVTGLAVTYTAGTIKVAVTALGLGDIVSVIAFA